VRKLILLFLVVACPWLIIAAQSPAYWQQEVDYRIDVALNDKNHSLDGFARIEYGNHSPDTLTFIWFHLWPNAYRNDKTAFTDQALENGNTAFYFSEKEQKGYINRLDFKVNSTTVVVEDHPQHLDIVKVHLPEPLLPGGKVTISTPFHVKLPHNFSRGGHDGQSYQATQWYPKPAVYDRNGWHPLTYLDQGEFYSEFGSFDVQITVPANYVVAATGSLQDENEKEWLRGRASFSWTPPVQKGKDNLGKANPFPASATEIKTLRYTQSRIHDFAWFADKRFIVNTDTCMLPSGKIIEVYSYYTPEFRKNWDPSLQFAKDGARFYSRLVGEYPYPSVSVVQGPESFGGGMEYPMITVISPQSSGKALDAVIAHEIGHNWFYGILASNERAHPWMDEGLNSYYEHRYIEEKYGKQPQAERILFETKAATRTDQPISLHAEKFSEANYFLGAYYKTAEWLRYLEGELGTDVFLKAMQEYYRDWQFRHPGPADFKSSLQASSGKNLDSAFRYLNKTGTLPNQQRKGTRAIFIFDKKGISSYLKEPSRNLLLFGPAIGFNMYDKLLAGAFFSNFKLPPSRFRFFVAPMYGTGSKKPAGLGLLGYSFYPNGLFRKVDLHLNGSTFTMNEFATDSGETVRMSFSKLVPGIRFTFREKNARSHVQRYIHFKTFLIGEDQLRFYRDSIFNPPDTFVVNRYGTRSETRTINQVRFVYENNRALYPHRGEWKIDQGKDFVRAGFTGNYFFNYPMEGGLSLRLFAGKFFYTSTRTLARQFATDRYHLNMTGANGYEDYTYQDYFAGRNRFDGWASQQIMVRDGGFKVRTDLLGDKVGRTDDWLVALNLQSSIPSGLNPLSMLPVKIPLRIFFDIGTHAEAWEKDAEGDRFIFDAGLQLSFFKETINIYVPILYSGVFRDYIQSTLEKKGRLWRTVSFSIDISNFSFGKIERNLVL